MNQTLTDQFCEDCGVTGHLVFDVLDDGQTHRARRIVHRPYLLAGRHPAADLPLRHEQVRRRHCYLQMIDGQLFGIDLATRASMQVDGRPCRMAWVARGSEVRVGPVGLVLKSGDAGGNALPADAPSPLSARYAREHPALGPGASLEIASAGAEAHRWRMNRVLVLLGRSRACKVKLISPLISEIHCALLRTQSGVWLIDLLSQGGVYVDGKRVSTCRLDEGATLALGPFTIRLRYESEARTRGVQDSDAPGEGITATACRNQGPIHETDDPTASMPEELRQVLLMTRTVGAIHRDQMDVVREEHEAIRRLAEEIYALRAQLASHPSLDALLGAISARGARPHIGLGNTDEPVSQARSAGFPIPGRRDPRELQEIASQFLAAYRHEQASLRERIIRILLGPSARVGSGFRA